MQSSDSAVLSYIQPLNQHNNTLDLQFQKEQSSQQNPAPAMAASNAPPTEPSNALNFSAASSGQQPFLPNMPSPQQHLQQQQVQQAMNFQQQLLMFHHYQQQLQSQQNIAASPQQQ